MVLLITAVYVLPVKEFFSSPAITAVADMDDEKAEKEKTEKSKELFTMPVPGSFIYAYNPGFNIHITPSVPLLPQTVVSPPPDAKG